MGRQPSLRRVLVVFAVALGMFTLPAPPPGARAAQPRQKATVAGEVLGRRTETSRTVRNDDGTLTTSLFSTRVHAEDAEGLWQPIDTTLRPSASTAYAWSSGHNSFTAHFPRSLGRSPVAWETEGQTFKMTLLDAADRDGSAKGASVVYPEAFPGVAVRYDVEPSAVKETLTISRPGAPSTYRFRIDAPAGSRAEPRDDGSWAFWVAPQDDPLFVLPAAFAVEVGEQHDPANPHARMIVRRDGDDFDVDVVVDEQWLADPQRRFPIQVDPAVGFDATSSGSYGFGDTCSPFCSVDDDRLRVGTTNTRTWRSALRFDTSSLPVNADIHSASFNVFYDNTCLNPVEQPEFVSSCGLDPHVIGLHKAGSDWSAVRAPAVGGLITSATVPAPTIQNPVVQAQWLTFPMLSTVRNWHSGSEQNKGLVLNEADETRNGGPAFLGPRHADWFNAPYISITFDETVKLLAPEVVHSDGAELSWTRYAGTSGVSFHSYDIYRGFKMIGSVKDVNKTTFQDTTAAGSSTFQYSIKVNGVGTSNAVSVTTPAVGQARLDIQPDDIRGRVAQIRSYSTTSEGCANYGSDQTVTVGRGPDFDSRTLLGFDTSAIPAEATISSATMSLFHDAVSSSSAGSISAHAVEADWVEGAAEGACGSEGVTWESRDGTSPWQSTGGDHVDAPASTMASAAGQAAGWDTFDVKSILQQWSSGTRGRHGIMLKATDASALMTYHADDAADPTRRPKLSVTFTDGRAPVKPVVTIASPVAGSILRSADLKLTADASDDGGAVTVFFYANGASVGSSVSAPPYTVDWNPANGNYRLTAVARDDAGNLTTSSAVNVTVDRSAPPSVSIVTPAYNAAIGATPITNPQPVSATASDDVGVSYVEFLVDGESFNTMIEGPYAFDWNTLDPYHVVTDGEHVLTARAYDAQGQFTESAPVRVKVDNNAATIYRASIVGAEMPATFEADTTTESSAETMQASSATTTSTTSSSVETVPTEVTVTNNSPQTWQASRVQFAYRWMSRHTPPNITTRYVSLGSDLPPGASRKLSVLIQPPALAVGVDRALYTLRFDMHDKSQNVYFSEKGSPAKDSPAVVVDHQLAKKLGLERYYHYLPLDVGAGMQQMVNIANGNNSLRWTPFTAPGRGLSTVVDLTYNSRESHSRSPAGNAFNLSVSGLVPLGERLKIHPPGKGTHHVEFTDGDGTTHRFNAVTAQGDPNKVLYYNRPDGVHLYLRQAATTTTSTKKWALTRPDRTTFFFDEEGYPTSIEDGNTNAAGLPAPNRITFGYETVDPADDPGGAKKRIITITDAAGNAGSTPAPNRVFNAQYYVKADKVQSRVRGRIKRLADHTGSALDFEYYDDGNLRRLIQRGGTNNNMTVADRVFVFNYTTSNLAGPAITDAAKREDPKAQTSNQSTVLYSVSDPQNRKETRFTYVTSGTDKGKLASRSDRANPAATDPKTTFAYDITTRTTTVVEPLTAITSRTSSYTYDTDGRVTRIVNPKQEATALTWSDNHVTSVTKEPKGTFPGSSTSYTYDSNGYVTSSTDELGNKTELTYKYESVDANDMTANNGGRKPHISVLETKTAPEGVATPETDAPTDHQWDFTHTGSNLTRVVEPRDAKGVRHDTNYTYYDNGDVKTVLDANKHTTTFDTYDANGLPTKVTDPLGRVTTMQFNDDGLLTWVQDAEHQGMGATSAARTEFFYDAFHRMRRQSTPKSTKHNLGLLWMGSDHDLNDNVVTQAQPHAGASYSPAPGDLTTMSYDVLDRLTDTTGPDKSTDASGADQAETTKMTYDLAGRTTTMTEPLGVLTAGVPNDFQTSYFYDQLDRVIRDERGLNLPAEQQQRTHYCYDVAGDLVRVTAPKAGLATVDCAGASPNYTSVFTYDRAHRTTSADDEEVHRTAERYDYDRNGNVIKTHFAQDKTAADAGTPADAEVRVYDERNRLVRVDQPFDRPAGADVVSTHSVYDGVGNVVESVSPRGWDASADKVNFAHYVTRYVYDAADQLITVALPTDGATAASYVHNHYDRNGRMDWTTLPNGVKRDDLQFDSQTGWPTNVEESLRTHMDYYDTGWIRTSDDGANPPVRFDYEPEGWQATRVPLKPAADAKPLEGTEVVDDKITWRYEDDGQLREQQVKRPGMDQATVTYDYDANNRLLSATDTVGATVAAQRPVVAESAYDTLNRVTKVRQRKQTSAAEPWQFTRFEYDPNNNVIRRYDQGEEVEDTSTTPLSITVNKAPLINEMFYDQSNQLTETYEHGDKIDLLGDERRITTFWHPRGWERRRVISKYEVGPTTRSWRSLQTTNWSHHPNGDLKELITRSGGDSGPIKEQHAVGYLDANQYYANGNRTRDSFTMANKTAADGSTPPCQSSNCLLEYVYDARDRLTREARSQGSTDFNGRTDYELTLTGGVKTEKTYSSGATTPSRTRTWTYRGDQMTSLADSAAGTQGYVYDVDGNIDCVVASATPQNCGSNLRADYHYDKLNRLVSFKGWDSAAATPSVSASDRATYEYDALDRVFSQSETHGSTTRATKFTYVGMTNTVSAEDRFNGAAATGTPTTTKSYSFDAFGNRVTMTNKESGQTTPETFTYGYDVHGSVSMLVKDGGEVRAAYGYRPYGEADKTLSNGDTDEDNAFNPYRYTGKRLDTGSKTMDMGARRFGPDTTKFLQQDQYQGALANLGLATDRLTQNRYSLAGGNPVSFIESDGHRVTADGGGGGSSTPAPTEGSGAHFRQAETESWTSSSGTGSSGGGGFDSGDFGGGDTDGGEEQTGWRGASRIDDVAFEILPVNAFNRMVYGRDVNTQTKVGIGGRIWGGVEFVGSIVTLGVGSAAVSAGKGAIKGVTTGAKYLDDAVSAGGKLTDEFAGACSFGAATTVVMADGTRMPISEIEVGDHVLAEDPETGERGARKVNRLWIHEDRITDLEVEGGDRVSTTEDHPFWNVTDSEWQRADALDRGDLLLTSTGHHIAVTRLDAGTARTTTAYNLTVDDIHTYFVRIGSDDVLVHNNGGLCDLSGYREHLKLSDLDAAKREAAGEVVSRKASGAPFDHLDEVTNAQRGLLGRIERMKRRLGWPGLPGDERAQVEGALGEASRLLDYSERYVPRP